MTKLVWTSSICVASTWRGARRPAPDAWTVGGSIPGRPLSYKKYLSCRPDGSGDYSIAGNDEIEVGEEGFVLDERENLRRVRAVDVYLTPENVNRDAINSDMYCCTGESLEHCVGKRLLVDAFTGDLVTTYPHCHHC